MRGRVLSLFLISFGLQGIGSIPLGAIAEVIGVPTAVLISGGLLSTSLILVIFLVPRLRAL